MRRQLWKWRHRAAPYLFLLPFALLFIVFLAYPLGRSAWLALHQSWGPGRNSFVGLENFRFLLRDRLFWLAVLNTAAFTAGFVLLQVPLSLGLALLVNHPRLRGRRLARFAFFSSYLTGPVFVAVLFAVILDTRHGLVNRVLAFFIGPAAREINWLATPNLVLPAVLLAALWLSAGFGMIYLLAALQAVEHELYDAAAVDRAGPWSRFWHVTLPSIAPVLRFLVLVGIIGGFQLFELPYVMFQGAGPDSRGLTIVMYLFLAGFDAGNLGYAAAVGWFLVLLIGAAAFVQQRAMREKP